MCSLAALLQSEIVMPQVMSKHTALHGYQPHPPLCRRDAGAISSLVALLQPGVELPSDLLKAVLKVLLGLAHDELSCEAIQQSSGIPRIIKLLEYAKDDQVRFQPPLR